MNCPKCGRQWDVSNKIASPTYVCPYCGETIDGSGHSKKNLGEVIESIIADFGEDVIENTSRLNALLMDYAPDMAKERKLVINALKEGVLTQLRKGLEEDHEQTYRRDTDTPARNAGQGIRRFQLAYHTQYPA